MKDPRVDEFILHAEEFAQPILYYLRGLVHEASDLVEENIKWGMPAFEYKGMFANMGAFKKHCVFCFNKGKMMSDPYGVMTLVGKTSMGEFGKLTSIEDLPSREILIAYIHEAILLNEKGVKLPKVDPKADRTVEIHPKLADLLSEDEIARQHFASFSYTNKKDYADWIMEAKTETTRDKRIATTKEWLQEGKIRNWKYVKKKK